MKKGNEIPEALRMAQMMASKAKELNFRCPRCGGDTLSRGEKNYLRVSVFENGEMAFGGDNLVEEQSDFACYDCDLIICQGQEPIRKVEDMIAWLKANCEQEDSQI